MAAPKSLSEDRMTLFQESPRAEDYQDSSLGLLPERAPSQPSWPQPSTISETCCSPPICPQQKEGNTYEPLPLLIILLHHHHAQGSLFPVLSALC